MSHTPGPWHCTLLAPSDEYCLVPWIDSPQYPGEQEWLESEADARLIAAAPDLLAALEAIVQEAEPLYAGFPDAPPFDSAWALMKQARAAIAKAKGEA